MGLQRNFKVMGIFSRLCIRDNKPQYLADIPLVIQYFLEVARKYEEMAPFLDWFEKKYLSTRKRNSIWNSNARNDFGGWAWQANAASHRRPTQAST